jgi:anti-anti-sigma regulatory factor
MRPHGVVNSATNSVPFGHMGWGFTRRTEFLTAAAEYIADGLRQHQLVMYVGDAGVSELQSELAGMACVTDMVRPDQIVVRCAADYYPFQSGTDILDAEQALSRYLAAAQNAVARGYTGFRAVVDVTSVARTVAQRDALSRLEFLVDQQMTTLPFAALCAYNLTELGSAAEEVVCLHPFVSAGSTAFQLFADPAAAISFALTGELDASTKRVFAATLDRIWPALTTGTLHVDATELTFVDHRSLMELDDAARKHNHSVVLHTEQPGAARIIDLLKLSAVSAVKAAQGRVS